MKKLSILIPTVTNRKHEFERLYDKFIVQRNEQGFKESDIEILFLCDNKQMSIGSKRQKLYEMAKGIYSVQWDDDDLPGDSFIKDVMDAIQEDSDCITYREYCTFNGGNPKRSNFSIKYSDWADNQDGFDYVRTPFFKCPIKTAICLQVGVKDMRYGEDHDFARRIKPLLKTETHIDKPLYIYRYRTENHNIKYGIK